MVELDHVILGTPDLEATARRLEEHHRLASLAGGRHTGLGTENRIVALGEAYLELMGVADPAEAEATAFGRWVLDSVAGGEAYLGWCVRTDDLNGVCDRLGLEPLPMSRRRPDGSDLSWRLAGLDRTQGDRALPFFIQWDAPDEQLPGRQGGESQAAGARIAAVEVGADEEALTEWLGELPGTVRVVDGEPGVHAVTIAAAGGVEVLRAQAAQA